MKLMRSRFRLISLLLTCAFLLAAVVCTAAVLKQADVTLPSVRQLLPSRESDVQETSSVGAEEEAFSPSPDRDSSNTDAPEENIPAETDNLPETEYNVFGL